MKLYTRKVIPPKFICYELPEEVDYSSYSVQIDTQKLLNTIKIDLARGYQVYYKIGEGFSTIDFSEVFNGEKDIQDYLKITGI